MATIAGFLQTFIDKLYHYGLPFVVVISILVFIHEFGHYWVARRCGVKVEAFSIGFGPELFGRTDRAGTRWRVALVPKASGYAARNTCSSMPAALFRCAA